VLSIYVLSMRLVLVICVDIGFALMHGQCSSQLTRLYEANLHGSFAWSGLDQGWERHLLSMFPLLTWGTGMYLYSQKLACFPFASMILTTAFACVALLLMFRVSSLFCVSASEQYAVTHITGSIP